MIIALLSLEYIVFLTIFFQNKNLIKHKFNKVSAFKVMHTRTLTFNVP
jgi:hypothetical protein